MEKEQAYCNKDSEAGDKEMVSESSDNEDDTETASEISEHQESENPDLEPETNADVPYSEETESSKILRPVKGPIIDFQWNFVCCYKTRILKT